MCDEGTQRPRKTKDARRREKYPLVRISQSHSCARTQKILSVCSCPHKEHWVPRRGPIQHGQRQGLLHSRTIEPSSRRCGETCTETQSPRRYAKTQRKPLL